MTAFPTPTIGQLLAAHDIRQVECLTPDITGYPRGKLMPARTFASGGELRMAEAVITQAVTGQYPEDERLFPDSDPDVLLRPDPDTLRLVPWARPPRALSIHDCVGFDGTLCRFSPRTVLREVLARYQAAGLRAVIAPEIEFYLTAPQNDPSQPLAMPGQPNGRPEVGQSAFSTHSIDDLAPFWAELNTALETLGIAADTWIHEMGSSQFEINLLHGDPLALADQAFLFKYATRQIAFKHSLAANFMSKPLQGQPGSSMHLHQSVTDLQGENIFSAADGSPRPRFGHFLGGLQTYLPDLMLLFAPFVNSFRRYVAHSQAPRDLSIGDDSREAGLRIPRSGPAARRVENRLAGADANPYLAMAASLAAGLAGMQEQIPPRTGAAAAPTLPSDYLAALRQLDGSSAARRLLGTDFIDGYVRVKQTEYDSFLAEISPWERRFLAPQA